MSTNNQETEETEVCPAAASFSSSESTTSAGAPVAPGLTLTQTNDTSQEEDQDVAQNAGSTAYYADKKQGKIRTTTSTPSKSDAASKKLGVGGIPQEFSSFADDDEDMKTKKEGMIPSSRLNAAKYSRNNMDDDRENMLAASGQLQSEIQNLPVAAASSTPSQPGAFSMRHGPDGHLHAEEVGGEGGGGVGHNDSFSGSLVYGLSSPSDSDDEHGENGDEENQQGRRTSTTRAAAAGGGGETDNAATMNDSRGGRLARARPVDEEDPLQQVHDTPVTPVSSNENENERKKQQDYRLIGIVLFGLACVAMGFIFGFVLGNNSDHSNNNNQAPVRPPAAEAAAGSSLTTLTPSFGTATSSPALTSAPTDALDIFRQQLPDHTLQNLQDISTPQWKAWDWLSRHPDLSPSTEEDGTGGMPLWRQGQLFALACFYFAMEGPTAWPEVIRSRWLRYDRNECFWYSSEFGWFDDDGTYHEGAFFYGEEPCNENGEIQVLALEKLGLEDYPTVHLPREMEYLSDSLQYLQLRLNNIQASLLDFIPTQIYDMPFLKILNLNYNKLTGTIPSEMGRLANTTWLEFWENSLSGTLPSELGQISTMKNFDFAFNRFTGTIPSEIALMTDMNDALYLQNNRLTGQLPSEFGLLSNLPAFHLENNMLTGSIPSQLGMMTSVIGLWLYENDFSGSLPSELGLLLNATQMSLTNNHFEGSMPTELCPWDCREKISPFPREGFLGRATSVSSDGCNCTVGTTYPLSDATNEVVINVQFDGWPEETNIYFEELEDNQQTWVLWLNVSGGSGPGEDSDLKYRMSSYRQASLASNTLYRFRATDAWGDGICCGGGLSITNGTASASEIGTPYDGYRGTIMWSTLAFEDRMVEVYLWVDENGHVSVVSQEEGTNLTSTTEGTANGGDSGMNDDDGSTTETPMTTLTNLLPLASSSAP